MINANLTAAIAACHTTLANIPFEAPDDEMDLAVQDVAQALDLVCRITAFTIEEAEAKLAMSTGLEEWDNLRDRLVQRATNELLTIIFNARLRAA